MKKKEYLILFALIIALGLYLTFKDTDRDYNQVPDIAPIDTQKITRIQIKKGDSDLIFSKTDKGWTISENAYDADAFLVNNILAIFKSFKLSTLVTKEGVPEQYSLDDSQRIYTAVFEGDKKIFELQIGKTAPSLNHTFVSLMGDTAVYHASGSFRSHFDKTLDEFRDKKILGFKDNELTRITLSCNGTSKTLTAVKETGDKGQTFLFWRYEDGTNAKVEIIKALFAGLNYLECDGYLPTTAQKLKADHDPDCRILLETKDKAYELTLFNLTEKKQYPGLSSMNNYAFYLTRHKGGKIIENVRNLLGIEANGTNN